LKKILLYTALILGCLGCLPEPIPIELDQLEPAPVVWSQVLPGDGLLIYFARSFGALELNESSGGELDTQALLSQVLVQDGIVTLEYDQQVDTLLKVADGVFTSFTTPLIENEEYYLRVEDYSNGDVATSTATLLPFVDIYDLTTETINQDDSSKTVRVHYKFEDLPGASWYQINYYSRFSNPVDIQDPTELAGVSLTQILSDQTFESTSHEGSFQLDWLTQDTVFVSINAISQDYYEYLALRERGGSFFTQVVQEPINYPSNVIGGYGFFNLAIPDFDFVVIED
jgi:hypothetical protein